MSARPIANRRTTGARVRGSIEGRGDRGQPHLASERCLGTFANPYMLSSSYTSSCGIQTQLMAGSLQQSPSREHSLANSTTATPPLPPSDPAPKSEPADEDLGSQTPPRPVAGCAHLEELDTDATAHLLKRYISGLRWGHQIRSGATSQHSANDSGRAGKRRKVRPSGVNTGHGRRQSYCSA